MNAPIVLIHICFGSLVVILVDRLRRCPSHLVIGLLIYVSHRVIIVLSKKKRMLTSFET